MTQIDESRHAGELQVPVNHSRVLRLDVPFSDLLVGNPDIADVLALSDRSVYVLGKKLGTTSLTIYGANHDLIAILDVVVAHDIAGLKARLFELMPDEKIEIRTANGALVMSGQVSSAAKLNQALAVAERYAPKAVTNLMTVRGSQQVMLAVRFTEMQRSIGRELGLNTALTDNKVAIFTGDTLLRGIRSQEGFTLLPPSTIPFIASDSSIGLGGLGPYALGPLSLSLVFEALERKGLVKTLAEPNLIVLSGDTASFLAGGEFPVPVARNTEQGGTTTTVEFKEFGVRLAFTPTVLDSGLVNIVVRPEVSKIDRTNAVTSGGFDIPGLSTRRASTTVELRDGESFAIAGLLQNEFEDTVRQFPILGDIPILGTLFRSTDFQKSESELVILVTPHLVRPGSADSMASPVDRFKEPSDAELFLLGRNEGAGSSGSAAGAALLGAQGAGGIVGRYGHIIR